MKLVMDLVVNHTSDEHPWFVESPLVRRQPEARLVLVAAAARRAWRPGAPGAEPTNWALVLLRAGLGARRGDRRVLPAPVLPQAAGPELGEPGGPRGGLRDDALVARPRGRRLPDGRHQPDLQGHGRCPTAPVAATALLRRRRPRRYVVRPAHPRVPAGDAPRGVRRPARAAADRRGDARASRSSRRGCSPTRRAPRSTWCSSSSTSASTTARAASGTSRPLRLRDLKASFGRWQAGLADVGWNSLYWDNHDQPRVVSRFGDDGEYRGAVGDACWPPSCTCTAARRTSTRARSSG